MKKSFFCFIIFLFGTFGLSKACTGISLQSKDGTYIQARTIEWGEGMLPSEYVIIPRGVKQTSYTPAGKNGLTFEARYGIVGLAIIQKEFIAEGLNEAGLSAGLFYFPRYGSYETYDSTQRENTINDLQLVTWILSRFATVEEVKAAVGKIRIIGLEEAGTTSTVHWRIGDATGKQLVLEIMDGKPYFYENEIGVLTNSPGFPWHLTNLNNYVNLFPGGAPPQQLSGLTLRAFGAGSGFLGMPGDVTPPSRFVRAAFYKATAPRLRTAEATVLQAFHILNNFDIPIGIEHPLGKAPDIPSATQWTSVVDLTGRKVYYKTAYNNTIRCLDMKDIDFSRVKYQSHPLDRQKEQPIEKITIR